MRPRLSCISVVALVILFGNQRTRAESSTNDFSAFLQQSDACLQRLREIDDTATKLEQAIPPGQTVQLDCIHSRALKIKGLLNLTQEARKGIQSAVRAAKPDDAADSLRNVKMSCTRAEKLLIEAQACASNNVLQAAPPKEISAAETNPVAATDIKIAPRSPSSPVPHRFVERTARTCLHQEQFAAMLARAMDLKLDPHATPEDCLAALAKLTVEPLGGWRAGKCTTVDNVYVACARAMNLKVKDLKDPLSYGEALREEGLGVDTLLPERDPKLDPPFVLDSEVRAFLISGYAAPLPSAKRVTPD